MFLSMFLLLILRLEKCVSHNPKHGYEMVHKKSWTVVDTGNWYQRKSSCVIFRIRSKTVDILPPHTALSWSTQPSHSAKKKFTSLRLLVPIWWKKKACIFSKSTNFYLSKINEIKPNSLVCCLLQSYACL